MALATRIKRLSRKEYFWPCVIILVTLAFHLAVLPRPDTPLFDEQHIVPEAISILDGNGVLHPEHPPLAKLIVAGGIAIFGDNPFGWRIFSVLSGSLAIFLFYLLVRRLEVPKPAAVFATFILAFENLSFIQASIAMLDVYYVTLMMLAFWLFAKGKCIYSGIAAGLSTLAKLMGALTLPAIGFYWLMTRRVSFLRVLGTGVAAVVSFLGLMVPLDYLATGRLQNPISRVEEMLSITGSMTFEKYPHPYLSRPWDWILQYKPTAYWYNPTYIGGLSPLVWVLIIPSILFLGYLAFRGDKAGRFGTAWIAGTFLILIPASIITNRISFLYYFYPSVGAVCLGIGLGLWKVYAPLSARGGRARRAAIWIVSAFLLLTFASFVIMSPISGIPWQRFIAE